MAEHGQTVLIFASRRAGEIGGTDLKDLCGFEYSLVEMWVKLGLFRSIKIEI
jgi:hypothetical protein